jgi:hypothetical protein
MSLPLVHPAGVPPKRRVKLPGPYVPEAPEVGRVVSTQVRSIDVAAGQKRPAA